MCYFKNVSRKTTQNEVYACQKQKKKTSQHDVATALGVTQSMVA